MKSNLAEQQAAELESIRKLSCFGRAGKDFKFTYKKLELIAAKSLCKIKLVKFGSLIRRGF